MEKLGLHDFIGSTLYVSIDDNRYIKGTLVALDSQLNLLMNHVREQNGEGSNLVQRAMGLVSIPQSTIKSIKITEDELNNIVEFKHNFIKSIV
ncbi:hypothetical protein Kpol_1030p16 [Vanderwaltozyma polyspora DSM 70294]|uniref:Sm domain-containing protein n=1 Tax=Vanderwaltozyma polyspora (strain ATCC 22028 / DSM 70294 / BCRC 21397 / CBS 2163 / NBRC 10782 / NRRL Y-8283 / UCD 57-17) TaxID=436907 RepID=A7TMT6_VANPO|nr:uncharacterized protein Kpol_1030p16 [Vanderwaltozyma polyspora DSM 70294]EDO16408.1 hypothetical protein Kpol_1030p16 [Vanderwaltozyma polyspora DSM 70294]